MVDIDFFKRFNDTHGHDIGDQVLKLVAHRLAEAGGDGIAYRYGGEEFTVLFPQRGVEEALPDLERVRAAVQAYRMAVRGEDRPKKAAEGAKLRGARAPDKTLSVTVSIGVAAPGDGRHTPHQVLKAADEALYRAKKAGRNRVAK
jgi:GGDEF domain-containing protein